MTTPNQTALLRRILDHPRVKAYGEGRGWYAHACPRCGNPFFIGHCKPMGCLCHCDKCDNEWIPQSDIFAYTGPDLAAESNLHELLALADAIYPNGVQMWTVENEHDEIVHHASLHKPLQMHLGRKSGTGPTRTLAVLAALGRALNIGDTE